MEKIMRYYTMLMVDDNENSEVVTILKADSKRDALQRTRRYLRLNDLKSLDGGKLADKGILTVAPAYPNKCFSCPLIIHTRFENERPEHKECKKIRLEYLEKEAKKKKK